MTNAASAKGRGFEREIAALLGGKRTPLSGAQGGGDVSFDGTIWADWSYELKRRAALPVWITNVLAQAETDIRIGDRRRPMAVMREDGGRAIAVLYLDDLRVWAEALAEVGQATRVHDLARQLARIADELRRV